MEKKYFDLVVKDLSGEISPQEKKALKEWIPGNEKTYQELRDLWEKSYVDHNFQVEENAGWERLKERIIKSEQPRWTIFRTSYLKIAAAILLVLAASVVVYNSIPEKEIIATRDHIEIFHLPDGTEVWLNKNSTLTIEDFEGNERRVLLTGEAFFEVAKDPNKPFVIVTEKSVTRVLGTSFDLKAYPGQDVEINVRTGKVEFKEVESKDAVFLVKNEKAVIHFGTGKIVKEAEFFQAEDWADEWIEPVVVEEEKTQASKPVRENKALKEINSPKEYLGNDFSWKDNIIKQAVVEGAIVNDAIFTTYKNIKLKATYYTGNKNKSGVEYITISEDVKPGELIRYKFKLDNWFREASKVEVEIEDAHAIK